jgi:hypothetical protein
MPTPGMPTPGMPTPGMPTPGMPTPGMPGMPPAGMPMGGNFVQPNMPVSGMFMPGLPADVNGRPYIDYSFNVAMPGMFTITLMSADSSGYDPYLYLLQNGMEIDHDDDGAGYPNSRITRSLSPGSYTIRVSSFRQSVTNTTPFTLTVIGG